jgi:hypothetical protein
MNLAKSKEYKENRLNIEKFFTKENLLKTKKITYEEECFDELKEKGFDFEINRYKTMKNRFDYSELVIFYPDNFELKVRNNYSSIQVFSFKYEDKYYIATQEDYQGISIVDIEKRTIETFVPDLAKMGAGFCITEIISFDEDEKTFSIEGCIWACPEERRTLKINDFNNLDDCEYEFDYYLD